MIVGKLSPDLIEPDVLSIDFYELQTLGVQGIILDVDNTIVPWNEDVLSEDVIKLVARLKASGMRICLLSNSLEKRVRGIADILQIDAVPASLKPRKKAFKRAIEKLDLSPEKIVVIGDQIFTDIFGGKRMGLKTILVTPLSSEELLWTRFFRKIEKLILTKMSS